MTAFRQGLAEIFEVDVAEITSDFDLAAHHWDSLAIVSTLALIDECYGRLVDGAALADARTVAALEVLALDQPA